jgi:hypothetical protein
MVNPLKLPGELPMNLKGILLVSMLMALGGAAGLAEEVCFKVPLASLKLTEGSLPAPEPGAAGFDWRRQPLFQPYAALDGAGEAYVSGPGINPWNPRQRSEQALVVRTPKGKEITGRLYVPKGDFKGMVMVRFKVDPETDKPVAEREFYQAKEEHFRDLRERNLPGTAWFRHEETETAMAYGAKAASLPNLPRILNPASAEEEYDSTFALFSGGRALSENLQLDRVLATAGSDGAMVELTNLQGITVKAMDWTPLIKDSKPEKDFLAGYVPFDQHALFFASFAAMSRWLDEADADGTPVLAMFETRSEDANCRSRYQKQLCLELNELSRLLGPSVITSVAVTGSDPYLRTGSDLGVLYETKSPAVLKASIQARQAAAQKADPAVKAVKDEINGVAYSGVVSADRSVCSYVAAMDNVVLVCNSTYQLACLIDVAKGKQAALASQPEYTFFRSRYLAGDKSETAFLVLSDATIRRWCGPRWRIGNARRLRAAALLAEVQAAHMGELAAGTVKPGVVRTESAEAGEIRLTPAGAISSIYGTLDFLTPVAELPLTKVSKAEADAYGRWSTSYQQNWRQYFDPIAVRFALGARQLGAEITVMPLIAGTEYRDFLAVSTGAQIAPDAGDRHAEALIHLALGINPHSRTIEEAGNFLGNFSPSLKVNPLGWLGQCLAVYADKDPFWEDLGKAEKTSDFMEKNYPRLPIALYFEVKNPLGVTVFLTALRAYMEQTSPNMTTWENLEYHGQSYVKVTPHQEGNGGDEPTNLCVYYAAAPKSLVVTLSERVLKRALDRQQARQQAAAGTGDAAAARPWLGTNLCLQAGQEFAPILETAFRDEYRSRQQALCWDNLPILNEWKRLFPDQDPVKVHEQFWQTKLFCPGGGNYVWNEKWHTMESTVYGHPGEPKAGPKGIAALAGISGANLGLSFENQGLSAKAVLEREAK